MFTQCSHCDTVFKLSAQMLRTAGGQLRCGQCGETFNALARLAEDSNGFATGESSLDLESLADSILESAPAAPAATKLRGDGETLRHDGVTLVHGGEEFGAPGGEEFGAPGSEELGPPGIEIAHLEILDDEQSARNNPSLEINAFSPADPLTASTEFSLDDLTPATDQPLAGTDRPLAATDFSSASADLSLEFTLLPGELDRIFVDAKHPTKQRQPSRTATPAPAPTGTPTPIAAPTGTPTRAPAAESGLEPLTTFASVFAASPAEEAVDVPAPGVVATTTPSGLEVPEEVRRQMLAGIDEDAQAARMARMLRGDTPGKFAGVPKLRRAAPRPGGESQPKPSPVDSRPSDSTLDLGQGIRRPGSARFGVPRSDAAADGVAIGLAGKRRPLLAWSSAAVAAALLLVAQIIYQQQDWFASHVPFGSATATDNLAAYQLRQWGVTADPAVDGTLRLRASILNNAARQQPYPLLRVTLANRFGAALGTREFEPSEYLGKAAAHAMAPGERADATLDILDPDKNAEGFEIDVCLRHGKKIQCANERAAPTKK